MADEHEAPQQEQPQPAPDTIPTAADDDQELDDSTQPTSAAKTEADPAPMATDGANDALPTSMRADAPETEARIPQKKDATLREFLGKMDEYAPIVRLFRYPCEKSSTERRH